MNQPNSLEESNLAQDLSGKYLTFNLAAESYGLEILKVREIIGMMPITTMPRTPEFVLGVINLRGKVIPVVDLRLKFGLDYRQPDERTCIVVVEARDDDSSSLTGVVVDCVNEVAEVKSGEVEPIPSFGVDMDTSFILGMAKSGEQVKTLLDIDSVLAGAEEYTSANF